MVGALFPRTRRAVLGLLFGRPEEDFYLRQIVRITAAGRGAVQRELQGLTRAGLLTRERRGNLTFYRANRASPLFPELHGLMVKTVGVAEVIREALAAVEGIRLALIYGSVAAETEDAQSDVDVLIVSDTPFAAIAAALSATQSRLGREVNPSVYSRTEFAEKREARHHFLTEVLEGPKIMLVGSLDDPL